MKYPCFFPGKQVARTRYLGSKVLAHRIEQLVPNTLYRVGVRAVFSRTEGPEAVLTHRTGKSCRKNPPGVGMQSLDQSCVQLAQLVRAW